MKWTYKAPSSIVTTIYVEAKHICMHDSEHTDEANNFNFESQPCYFIRANLCPSSMSCIISILIMLPLAKQFQN